MSSPDDAVGNKVFPSPSLGKPHGVPGKNVFAVEHRFAAADVEDIAGQGDVDSFREIGAAAHCSGIKKGAGP
jgi:hypothetical protein